MACAVPFGDLESIEIKIRQTVQVDAAHGLAVGALTFGKGRDATGGAEMMLQAMTIEGVGRKVGFGRFQLKGVRRHKGQKSAASSAKRAVTVQAFGKRAFDLISDLAAMAASLMQHGGAPVLNEITAGKIRKQERQPVA